jgi:hypothetical protein
MSCLGYVETGVDVSGIGRAVIALEKFECEGTKSVKAVKIC